MNKYHNLILPIAILTISTQPILAQDTTEKKASEATTPETKKSEAKTPEVKTPEIKLDYGDFSSKTLTAKAWAAHSAKNNAQVEGYTKKCIEMFEKQALEMQAKLKAPAPAATAHDYWALNDISTCYLIRAQSREAKGDTKGATEDYKAIVEKFSYGQCWDVKGWFWKPADAAKVKIKELAFDTAE